MRYGLRSTSCMWLCNFSSTFSQNILSLFSCFCTAIRPQLSIYITLCVYLLAIPHCLDYCSFILILKSGNVSFSTFLMFLKIALALLDFFLLHIHSRMYLWISTNNSARIFIGIMLNL